MSIDYATKGLGHGSYLRHVFEESDDIITFIVQGDGTFGSFITYKPETGWYLWQKAPKSMQSQYPDIEDKHHPLAKLDIKSPEMVSALKAKYGEGVLTL